MKNKQTTDKICYQNNQRGKQLFRQCLSPIDGLKLYDVVIQDKEDSNRLLEIDSIVYYHGKIFCIQNKHYSGKVSLNAIYHPIVVYRKMGILRIPYIKNVYAGFSTQQLCIEDNGDMKKYLSPILELEHFIEGLKKYLRNLDRAFENIPIETIVSFSNEEVDLKSVIQAMPKYTICNNLKHKLSEQTSETTENDKWIENNLSKLPKKDRICTKNGTTIVGKIEGVGIHIKTSEGEKQILYAQIQQIDIIQESNKVVRAQVTLENEEVLIGELQELKIGMSDFKHQKEYKINQLTTIIVGTQPLRAKGFLSSVIA
ncbi:MAG: NERD domain-containing protein [Cellulosilyticaceae bacterium]